MADQSTYNSSKKRIEQSGRGSLFFPDTFADAGTSYAIRSALVRLCENSILTRVAQGIYCYPNIDTRKWQDTILKCYIKFTKQRKAALPDEVLEVVISEEEYLHFEVIGNARESDVVRNKTNLRRYGQIPDVEEPDEEEAPEEDGRGRLWTDEDTERLIELAATLETPDKETIGLMMERHPNFIYRKAKLYGIQLMSKPRGRKPKPDEQ